MQHGDARRDHERVAGDQAGEDDCRAYEGDLRRIPGQDDREPGQQEGGDHEAETGRRALLEVVGDEGRVNAGAHCAGENDNAGAELGQGHVSILVGTSFVQLP